MILLRALLWLLVLHQKSDVIHKSLSVTTPLSVPKQYSKTALNVLKRNSLAKSTAVEFLRGQEQGVPCDTTYYRYAVVRLPILHSD